MVNFTENTALSDPSVENEDTNLALTEEEKGKIREIKSTLNPKDADSIVLYGVGVQRRLAEYTDTMLSSVCSGTVGQVGDLLSALLNEINSLDPSSVTGEGGFFTKIFGDRNAEKNAKGNAKKLAERYSKAEGQIGKIESALEKARMQMLKDISVLDIMYEKNEQCYEELTLYIQAGKEKIAEIRNEMIEGLDDRAKTGSGLIDTQFTTDYEEAIESLEKKIYDLEVSRTIAAQAAPQMKMIQKSDRLLVDKIQTAVLSTIPVWKSQYVSSMGLNNQKLIGTIKETLEIQKEGSRKRIEAEEILSQMEGKLHFT